MTMRKVGTFLIVALVVVGLLGSLLATSAAGQSSRTRFSWLIVDKLNVGADGATVAGDLSVSGDATVTGGLTTSADVSIGDDLNVSEQSAATITQAGSLTPAGTYQPITAAGPVSFGDITAGSAGDLLVLINEGSNTITITDTGTLKLSGNAALGQFDTITLWSDGTNWVEIAQTDN